MTPPVNTPIVQQPLPQALPVAAPAAGPPPATTATIPGPSVSPTPSTQQDNFNQARIKPTPPSDAGKYRLSHAMLYGQVQQAAQQAQSQPTHQTASESPEQRIVMFFELYNTLDERGKKSLKALLPTGKLFRTQSEDNHSTLYHLYAMATTPRLKGIDGPRAARDLLSLIDNPDPIVQTFVTLMPQDAQQMLKQFNLHPSDLPPTKQNITMLDYLQSYSADCVPAAIMARQAISNYDELARQLNEITGLGYFNETVRAEEIWPKNPAEAESVMQEWQWTYQPKPGQPGAYTVRFITPDSVKTRMEYAHRRDKPGQEQTPIEGGYQGTLAYQGAGKRYNGILGKRWDPTNNLSIGLNAIEKTVLENAIEDGKSIHSVQYQVATGRKGTEEDSDSYLFGYTVPFSETQKHILLALDTGWKPVAGFIETDSEGRVQMAHEVMIKDKKWVGNKLYFEVIDTDDDNPKTVLRAAEEFIPKLHHLSYPFGLAQRIEADINSHFQQYYVPNQADQARFKTITVSPAKPMDGWEAMVWPEQVEAMQQQAIFPNQAPAIPRELAQQPPGALESPTFTPNNALKTAPVAKAVNNTPAVGVPTRPNAALPGPSTPVTLPTAYQPVGQQLPTVPTVVTNAPVGMVPTSTAIYPTPPTLPPLVAPNNIVTAPVTGKTTQQTPGSADYPRYTTVIPQ